MIFSKKEGIISRNFFFIFLSTSQIHIHWTNQNNFSFLSCESMSSIDEYIRNLSSSSIKCPNFDKSALNNAFTSSYSVALKQLLDANCHLYCCDDCTDYIARKICNTLNDDIGAFLGELKKITARNYKFDMVMTNLLMNHCIEHFDVHFHQFVLTQIVNKLTPPELDQVNQVILHKFVNRRMGNLKKSRMGLRHNPY